MMPPRPDPASELRSIPRCFDQLAIADRHIANDRPGIRVALEPDQRGAGRDHIPWLAMEDSDRPGKRRGYLDNGFGRLHSHHGLVDRHHVAEVDVPTDDFRLGETFAEIREIESPHLRSVRRRLGWNHSDRISRTASMMRAAFGM